MTSPIKSLHNNLVVGLFVSLIAGTSLTLAFAPYDLWIIAIISPAILFYIWHKSSPEYALVTGYFYGLGMFGSGVSWLHISINLFGGINIVGAWFITFTLVAFLAIYTALVGYFCRKFFSDNETVCVLAVIPAIWVLAEWFRSWIFTGFPWLNLGYSQTDTWLAGFAPVTGIYGISWIVGLCAALLFFIFITDYRKKILSFIALIMIAAFSFLLNKIDWTTPVAENKTVTLVQAAIPQEQKWNPEVQQYTIDIYLTLTRPYWQSDLIIWPETAIPMFYHQARGVLQTIQKILLLNNADMLTGIPVKDEVERKYYNGVITLGSYEDIYYKRHLVPFGEYLPLNDMIRPIINMLGVPMSSFSPGTALPLVRAAGMLIGVSICYEDVFGEEVIDAMPDAMILVNVSNDAWFGDSIAPHQHLQMARMRARETGRYLLRATNTGISAIIDERGNVTGRSPQFTPHALHGTVRTFTGTTPYSVLGNYPVLFLNFLLIFVCLAVNKKSVSKNKSGTACFTGFGKTFFEFRFIFCKFYHISSAQSQ